MLNPVWLNTFAIVTNCRSFTEAGRQLGLNQSSVSEHIRRLEESVGRRLFVRDTHSIAMTTDGEALLVHANVILQALNRAESQFRKPRLKGGCGWARRTTSRSSRCRTCSPGFAPRTRTSRWKSPPA